jgi:predicted Fe-Mo cluster-binding NifX family protein
VSGHSGSDIISEQLISALNINKKFILAPYFVLMETSNNKGEILEIENIEQKAKLFAENIKSLFN